MRPLGPRAGGRSRVVHSQSARAVQAMEAMLRKRKQALLTQRDLDASQQPAARPGGLARLWGFVSGSQAGGPEHSLGLAELEARLPGTLDKRYERLLRRGWPGGTGHQRRPGPWLRWPVHPPRRWAPDLPA